MNIRQCFRFTFLGLGAAFMEGAFHFAWLDYFSFILGVLMFALYFEILMKPEE